MCTSLSLSRGLSGRNVSASHLLSSPLCSLRARQSTSLPLSLSLAVFFSFSVHLSLLLFCGCYSNVENSMSAVMFCGLRRDSGANGVGECGTSWGKSLQWLDCSPQFLIIHLLVLSSHCCVNSELHFPEIPCQSNIAWRSSSMFSLGLEV